MWTVQVHPKLRWRMVPKFPFPEKSRPFFRNGLQIWCEVIQYEYSNWNIYDSGRMCAGILLFPPNITACVSICMEDAWYLCMLLWAFTFYNSLYPFVSQIRNYRLIFIFVLLRISEAACLSNNLCDYSFLCGCHVCRPDQWIYSGEIRDSYRWNHGDQRGTAGL